MFSVQMASATGRKEDTAPSKTMFKVRISPVRRAKSFPAIFLNRAALRNRESAMFSGYRSLPRETEGGFSRCSFRITVGLGPEIMKVTHRLQFFKRHENVRLPFFDQGGKYLGAETDMGGHAPAPLGHAVNLALFHVVTGFQESVGHDLRGHDDPLAADADQSKCSLRCYFAWPSPIAPNLQICAHREHPLQRKGSMDARPFRFLPSRSAPSSLIHSIAGQAIRRQERQPRQISGST